MADKAHGILEDIGAELGYTATCSLVDWFGGTSLYIPEQVCPGHPIERVLGPKAFARLVQMGEQFDGRIIHVPLDYQREIVRRDRLIAALLTHGHGTKDIAHIALMSERHVQKVRATLEERGLIPLILKGDARGNNAV